MLLRFPAHSWHVHFVSQPASMLILLRDFLLIPCILVVYTLVHLSGSPSPTMLVLLQEAPALAFLSAIASAGQPWLPPQYVSQISSSYSWVALCWLLQFQSSPGWRLWWFNHSIALWEWSRRLKHLRVLQCRDRKSSQSFLLDNLPTENSYSFESHVAHILGLGGLYLIKIKKRQYQQLDIPVVGLTLHFEIEWIQFN